MSHFWAAVVAYGLGAVAFLGTVAFAWLRA